MVVDLSCRLNEAEVIKLKAENESLRRLLGANLPASWQFIPAKILSLKNDQLTINVGSKDGIGPGMNVLLLAEGNQGILIGRIERAEPYLAKVSLISGAKVKTESGASGEITGLQLIKVEQKYRLNQGDLIISEGGNGWLPDLLVGRVGKVDNVPTAVYQSAAVEPLVELENIAPVFVVKLPL